jgi:AcrR family transcriptional regulator
VPVRQKSFPRVLTKGEWMAIASTELRSASLDSAPDATVDAIYLAAAKLFREKGFAATSMNDLAKAMKMTKAGLYYYIRGKEDLLYRIVDRSITWVETAIIAPARELPDPEQRLRFIISIYGQRLLSMQRSLLLAIEDLQGLSPPHRREIDRRREVYIKLVSGTLEELRAQNKLRVVSTTVATFSVFAMLLSIPHWYPSHSPLSLPDALREITSVLLDGLLVSPRNPA